MTNKKPAGAKALAPLPQPADAGEHYLLALLGQMQSMYAKRIGAPRAARWLAAALGYLRENGALPGGAHRDAATGDLKRALDVVLGWHWSAPGGLPLTAAAQVAEGPISAGDILLVVAVADALGKAARLLDEKEEDLAHGRQGGHPEHPLRASAMEHFRTFFIPGVSRSAAADKARLELAKTKNGVPSQKSITDWSIADGLEATPLSPFTKK